MGNTFITSKKIAREAMPILEANKVMAALVHTDYKNEFQEKYNTVTVTKPAKFTAVEFDGDLTGEYQDVTQGSVDVSLDYIASVDMKITSKQRTLDIAQFNEEITAPAIEAITQQIDAKILGLYTDVPYFYGTSGTTPDELKDISQVRKILQENLVPIKDRRLVIDSEAEAEFGILDQFVSKDYIDSGVALQDAILGKKLNFSIYADQNVKTHTAGTFTAVTTPLTNGTIAADATTLTLDGGSGTETLLVGDLIQIGTEQFVVTANATASGGAVSVSVYPAVAAEISDGTAVVFPDKTAKAHTANLAFHKNAFAFVSRPLMPASGEDSYTTSYNGIPIRVTMGYDFDTKSDIVSFDCLYGVKTLYPELAAVLLG